MISVTFDSNLIQKVLAPDEYKDDSEYDLLNEINRAIRSGKIVAVVSEMYFTQEALCKNERSSAFANNATGGVQVHSERTESGVRLAFKLGPSQSAHLTMNCYQKKYFEIMRELGIKVLKTYRLGDFVNDDLARSDFYDCPSLVLGDVQQRNDECCNFIEHTLNAGKHLLDNFLSNYPGRNIYEKATHVPDNLKKRFAKLVAEMADGQTVAIHYANNINYLCTRDEASSAGTNSVLSYANRMELSKKYSIKIINISDLVKIIKGIENN